MSNKSPLAELVFDCAIDLVNSADFDESVKRLEILVIDALNTAGVHIDESEFKYHTHLSK